MSILSMFFQMLQLNSLNNYLNGNYQCSGDPVQFTHVLSCLVQDPTPVCTPTFLERRKSQPKDSEDNEVILKLPPESKKTAAQKNKAAKLQKKATRKKQKSKT